MQILEQIERGDPPGAERLLPLVYAELKRLAAAKMAAEPPDDTLEATALVREACPWQPSGIRRVTAWSITRC